MKVWGNKGYAFEVVLCARMGYKIELRRHVSRRTQYYYERQAFWYHRQVYVHVKLSMVLTFFHSVPVSYLSNHCYQCFKSKSCATNSEGFEEFYVSHPGRSPVDWRSVLLIDRSSFGAVTHPTGMFMQFPNQASGEKQARECIRYSRKSYMTDAYMPNEGYQRHSCL